MTISLQSQKTIAHKSHLITLLAAANSMTRNFAVAAPDQLLQEGDINSSLTLKNSGIP